MNSGDLQLQQIEQLQQSVGRSLRYFNKLRSRMERRGFTSNDELFRLVGQAHEAIFSVNVALHYLSVDAHKRERQG